MTRSKNNNNSKSQPNTDNITNNLPRSAAPAVLCTEIDSISNVRCNASFNSKKLLSDHLNEVHFAKINRLKYGFFRCMACCSVSDNHNSLQSSHLAKCDNDKPFEPNDYDVFVSGLNTRLKAVKDFIKHGNCNPPVVAQKNRGLGRNSTRSSDNVDDDDDEIDDDLRLNSRPPRSTRSVTPPVVDPSPVEANIEIVNDVVDPPPVVDPNIVVDPVINNDNNELELNQVVDVNQPGVGNILPQKLLDISTKNLRISMPTRYIPKPNREPLALIASELLSLVINSNPSEQDVKNFLNFPVLAQMQLSDLKVIVANINRLPAYMTHLTNHLLSDDHIQSLPSFDSSNDITPSGISRSLLKKVQRQCHSGRVGASVTRLESYVKKEVPASVTDNDVRDRLVELHPPRMDDDDDLEVVNEANLGLINITLAEFNQVLKHLPSESGCGCSSWCNETIQQLCKHSSSFADKCLVFINLMVNGKLRHSGIWLTSRLIAIQKANNKLRPIALAEPWIRFGSKLVGGQFRDASNRVLGSHQLGIGKKGGAEILVHSAQTVNDFMHTDGGKHWGILSMDCKNAFNSIRRKHIGEALRLNPSIRLLSRFFNWSYGSPTCLSLGHGVDPIMSATGVRQGDPLGPLLFSLGINHSLKMVMNAFPNVQLLAYLDDVFFFGPVDHIIAAGNELKREFAKLGLSFNADKCKLYTQLDPDRVHNNPYPIVNHGLHVLGIPVGNAEYVQQHLDEQLQSQTQILTVLPELPAPIHFSILRSSVNARPTYNVRGLRPELVTDYVRAFDHLIHGSLAELCSITGGQLPELAISLKNLSTDQGGIGMKDLEFIYKGAWVSSWLTGLHFIYHSLPKLQTILNSAVFDDQLLITTPLLPRSPNVVRADGASNFEHFVLPLIRQAVDHEIPKQKSITKVLESELFEPVKQRLASSDATKEEAALLVSGSCPGISSWLYSGTTSLPSLRLSHHAFILALRLRLLLPEVDDDLVTRRCESCHLDNIREHSKFHGLMCKGPSVMRSQRHDEVCDALVELLKVALPGNDKTIVREYVITQDRTVANEHNRADIFVRHQHQCFYIDVSVTCPCASNLRNNNTYLTPGGPGTWVENNKIRTYKNKHGNGFIKNFVPFVLESTGRFASRASQFLDLICGLGGFRPDDDSSVVARARQYFVKRVSMLIHRGNYAMSTASRRIAQVVQHAAAAPDVNIPHVVNDDEAVDIGSNDDVVDRDNGDNVVGIGQDQDQDQDDENGLVFTQTSTLVGTQDSTLVGSQSSTLVAYSQPSTIVDSQQSTEVGSQSSASSALMLRLPRRQFEQVSNSSSSSPDFPDSPDISPTKKSKVDHAPLYWSQHQKDDVEMQDTQDDNQESDSDYDDV